MSKPSGFILHRGTVNGHAFVAVVTLETSNRKTGPMAQVWFLLEDVSPVEGVSSGLDARTVCHGCPFASGGGCYVNVGQAPLSVWRAFHRGAYPVLEPRDYATTFAGRKVRFGAYGNPSLLPLSIVRAVAEASAGWTGYFHDWKTNPLAAHYARYFMASTETQDSFRLAASLGFRSFHVSPVQPEGTLECLSDAKGITCDKCRLCAGLTKSRLPSVWINPHGSGARKASAAALAA